MKKIILIAILFCITGNVFAGVRSFDGSPSKICGIGNAIVLPTPQDRYSGVLGPITGGTFSIAPATVATITASSAAAGATIRVVATGRATITFTKGAFSCSTVITVYANQAPVLAGPAQVCVGSSITITSTPNCAIWKSQDNSKATMTSGTTSGSLTGVGAGNVTVTGQFSDACGSHVGSKVITVYAKPTVTFSSSTGTNIRRGVQSLLVGDPVASRAGESGAFTHTGGHLVLTNFTGPSDPEFQYANFVNPGLEAVKYTFTESHGCSASFTRYLNSVVVRDAQSEEEDDQRSIPSEMSAGVKVFPNPNSGTFTIELPANDEGAQVIVNDITGRVVSSMNTGEKSLQMDLGNLPKGVYVLYVTTGDKRYTEKVVKE